MREFCVNILNELGPNFSMDFDDLIADENECNCEESRNGKRRRLLGKLSQMGNGLDRNRRVHMGFKHIFEDPDPQNFQKECSCPTNVKEGQQNYDPLDPEDERREFQCRLTIEQIEEMLKKEGEKYSCPDHHDRKWMTPTQGPLGHLNDGHIPGQR